MQSARRAVRAQIRANGQKIAQFSAREISVLAEAHLAQHRERLRAEAEHAIATWPGFAYLRVPGANIKTVAQSENEPKSTTSAVQMSGAE
jgi:microcystin-dependent protein